MLGSQSTRCIHFRWMSLFEWNVCMRSRCGYGVLQTIETVQRKIIPCRRIPCLLHSKQVLLRDFQLFLGTHQWIVPSCRPSVNPFCCLMELLPPPSTSPKPRY